MTRVFDSVTFEWFDGIGNWHNLTPDVLATPRPRGVRGIMGVSLGDRVGGVGTLTFSLDNSERNSVETAGYYTPGHDNAISVNWGRPYHYPVRLTVVYQGRNKILWYGTFERGPEGVKVIAGERGARKVSVAFRDWMGFAHERKLNLLPAAANKRSDEAVQIILDELDENEKPLNQTLAIGDSTFEAVFDNTNSGSTIYSELAKIAYSELGYLYIRSDRTTGEKLVLESRNQRFESAAQLSSTGTSQDTGGALLLETGDYLLLETGDKLLINNVYNSVSTVSVDDEDVGLLLLETGDYLLLETGDRMLLNDSVPADFTAADFIAGENLQVNYYDNAYPGARISVQQKSTGGSTVTLWSMELPLRILSGEVKTGIRGRFRDPSGGSSYINGSYQSTSMAAFANKNGTGTNYTSNITVTADAGSAEVDYTLENTGPDAWITQLDAIGYPIYNYDSLDIVVGDDTGKGRFEINLNYETDETVGRQYADEITKNADGNATLGRIPLFVNRNKFNMNAFMDLDIGSLIDVDEAISAPIQNTPYFINGYEFVMFPISHEGQAHWGVNWYPNGFPYSRVFIPD